MTILWLPDAERVAGAHAGGTLIAGPERTTWHITWDRLDPRPTFDNVRDYLVRENFEPTLLWDPETGRVAQFLAADRSAYAVRNLAGGVETNRLGDVHVQIEVYFSPGYKNRALFTDGPLVGLDKIMAWLDQLGVPRVAVGDWSNPTRDVTRWKTTAGHYGHFEVPENDHSDPIAGTNIALILAAGVPVPPPVPTPEPEDDMNQVVYVKRSDSNTVYAAFSGHVTDKAPFVDGQFLPIHRPSNRGFALVEEFYKAVGWKFVNYPVSVTIDDGGTKRLVWVINAVPYGDGRPSDADALGIPA